MKKSNNAGGMVTVTTTKAVKVNRKYDGTKYGKAQFTACAQALAQCLGTYKQAGNAYARQAVFAILSADKQADEFDSIIKYTEANFNPEIKRLVVAGCKHFKGMLPEQSELDKIDFFKLIVPSKKSSKKEPEHGAGAVLAFIADRMAKLQKSKKDYAESELKAWEVAFNALQNSIKGGR